MNAHVQYAGEISPKKLRGFVNVTSSVFLALGKAVARILGLRYLCCSFWSCFLFVFFMAGKCCPPSPRNRCWRWAFTLLSYSGQKGNVCSMPVTEVPLSVSGERSFSWERMSPSLEVQSLLKLIRKKYVYTLLINLWDLIALPISW